jgi:hypothetical protein
VTALASGNTADVVELKAMVDGTKLATNLVALIEADAAQAAAKAEHARRMKAIGRLMRG